MGPIQHFLHIPHIWQKPFKLQEIPVWRNLKTNKAIIEFGIQLFLPLSNWHGFSHGICRHCLIASRGGNLTGTLLFEILKAGWPNMFQLHLGLFYFENVIYSRFKAMSTWTGDGNGSYVFSWAWKFQTIVLQALELPCKVSFARFQLVHPHFHLNKPNSVYQGVGRMDLGLQLARHPW